MFRSWCRRRARGVAEGPARAAPTAAAAGRPPRLEWLEDRCLLATGLSPLSASASGLVLSALPGQPFTAPVAHLRLVGVAGVRAAINWGDGQTSAGTLRPDGGPDFDVLGTNTYQHSGFFAVGVSITGDGGLALSVTSQAIVSADVSVIYGSNIVLTVTQQAAFSAGTAGAPVFVTDSATSELVLLPVLGGGPVVVPVVGGQGPPAPTPVRAGPAPPPPPPGKLTPSQGPGVAALAAAAAGPRPAGPTPAPPRPVDPTTFFVWASQRDQGGTVRRPELTFAPATELTTVPAEPARLDVEAFFAAQQATEEAPPAPRNEQAEGGVARVVVTAAGAGREWLRDETVIAALADATRPPAVTPPAGPAAPAPAAPVQQRPRESRSESREKDRLLPRAAAWLVVTRLVCGLWGNWGWPAPARPRPDEALARGPARS